MHTCTSHTQTHTGREYFTGYIQTVLAIRDIKLCIYSQLHDVLQFIGLHTF